MTERIATPAPDADPRHQVIHENLDLMLRWVRRGIRHARKTGRLQAGSVDVLNSAVASFLNATNDTDYDANQPVEEIWEELRRHLNRKIDTWRHRVGNRSEEALRSADIADPAGAGDWLALVEDPSPSDAHARLWVEEILSLLERIEDPALRQLAELRMQTYTYEEITELTGWTYGRVQRATHRLKAVLRRLLDNIPQEGDPGKGKPGADGEPTPDERREGDDG